MPIQQSKGAMPGTVAAPGLYLGTDTTSGLYQIGNGNVGLSIGGTKILDFSSSAVAVSSTSVLRAVGGLNTGPSETTPFAAADVMIPSSNAYRMSYSGYGYKAVAMSAGGFQFDPSGLGITIGGALTGSGSSMPSVFPYWGAVAFSNASATVVTVPAGATYLFYSVFTNYGGSDHRHGIYFIAGVNGNHAVGVQLAALSATGGFSISDPGGIVSYSASGGNPACQIYWVKLG